MGHYAIIEEDNSVSGVICYGGEDGEETEKELSKIYNKKVLRTSYNTKGNEHSTSGKTPFRGNYAGKGSRYDPVADVFITPKPFASWLLNSTTYKWEAPVPHGEPEDGLWGWSEKDEGPYKRGWNLIATKPTE